MLHLEFRCCILKISLPLGCIMLEIVAKITMFEVMLQLSKIGCDIWKNIETDATQCYDPIRAEDRYSSGGFFAS